MASEKPLANHPLKDDGHAKDAKTSQNHYPVTIQSSDGRNEDEQNHVTPVIPTKPRDMNLLSWICVVISLMSSMFLFALDNTVVADVQPSIINTLGNVDKLPWVSVAYALGAISVNLFVSNLFTKFDNKLLFITGVMLFEIGSTVCGAAPSMTALIFGRVICGVGGVGIFVGAMNLLSLLTTETERPMYLSIVGLTWGTGTVLGPIIGGAFAASSATWRWSFYLNLCVGAVVAPVYIFILPSHHPHTGATLSSQLRELDWIGAILNAGAIASLIMGISFGGGVYVWSSGQIIGLFACSGVLWILFIVQQAFPLFTMKEHRLFPVDYLRSLEMVVLFAQIISAAVVVYIPLYFIPLYFQFVKNDSAFNAGVRLLPLIFFQVFGTVVSGAVMNKVRYYVLFYLVGGILSLIGGALLHTVKIDTSTGSIYGYSILIGLGSGLYIQTSYPIAQLKVDASSIPRVVSFIGFGQITGITLALTISHGIFLNEATNRIAGILPLVSRENVQQGIIGTRGTFFETLDPSDKVLVLEAIVQTIGNVYGMAIAAGGLTIILSMFMKRERLNAQSSTSLNAAEEGSAEKTKGMSTN